MFNDNAGTSLPALDSDCAEQGQDALSSSSTSSSSASSKRGRPRKTRESKRQPKNTRTPKREKKEELVEVTLFPSSSSSSSSSALVGPSSTLTSTGQATEGPNKEKSPLLKPVPQRAQVLVPNLRLGAIKKEGSFDDSADYTTKEEASRTSTGFVPTQKTPRKSPSSADREKRGDRLLDGTGRLKWTPELHHKFEMAVKKFGVQTALPTQILHEMNVEGLTRHHISSHLQKFRFEKFGAKRKKDYESPRDDDDQFQQQQQQQQDDRQDNYMPMSIVHPDPNQEQTPIPYPLDVHIHYSPPEEFMHPPHPPYYSPSPLDSPSSFLSDPVGLYRLQDEFSNSKDYHQSSQSDQQNEATKSRFNRPSGCTKPLMDDPSQNPSGSFFPISFSATASSASSASSTTTTTTFVRRRCSTGTTPLSKTMPSLAVQKPKPKRLSQSARHHYPPSPPPATETPAFHSQPSSDHYEQHPGLLYEHQQHQEQQVYPNAPSSNNPFQAENLFDTSIHAAFPSAFVDPHREPSSVLHSSPHGLPSGNLGMTTLSRTSSSSSSSRETITQTYHQHQHQHQHNPPPSFNSFTERSSPFSNRTPSPSYLSMEAFPSSSTSTRDSSSSSSSSSRPATPSSIDPGFPSFYSSSAHHQHHHNSSLPPYYEPNILGQLQQQQFFNPSQPSSSPYFDQTQQYFQHNYGSFYSTQDDPMTGPVATVTGAHTVGGQVSSTLSSTTSSTKSHGENLTNSLLTTFGTSHSSSDQTMLSPVFSPSPSASFSRSRSPSPSPQAPTQSQSHPHPQSPFVPLPFTSFNPQQ
eukprot:TRINITY_DN631_c0_g1_i1.p1 TRINITY_DN631_c0_g1~~TRINITY_DN631_c0_g1_i1.p1  ORF type:complete len:802 (+),score=305.62 TRINITY_DN631_c0_g1_i1:833-3238(+)